MAQKHNAAKIAKHLLRFVIPLVISAGLCYLLFTGIDFREMMTIIREQCNFWWIGLGFVFAVAAQVCRAYRWDIQLRGLGIKAPKKALILSIFGTYAVNLVFPRLGEVWRCGYIAQRQKAPFTAVFGSMVADRLSDTAAVLIIMAGAFAVASKAILSFLRENSLSYEAVASILTSPWLWGAVAACAGVLWVLMKVRTGNRWLLKLRHAVVELWQGFAVIATMPGKGRWLLWTLGIWGCYFMQNYVAFYAFPFTTALIEQYGLQVPLVAFVLGSISMGVPSNGGIGPWQWAVIFALGIYGLGHASAAAFANLSMGATTLLTILLGIVTFAAIALDKKKDRTANVKLQNEQQHT